MGGFRLFNWARRIKRGGRQMWCNRWVLVLVLSLWIYSGLIVGASGNGKEH